VSAIKQPMLPELVRVRVFQRDTHDTFTLTVEPPHPGWNGRPGQFNMLYAFGVGEAPISLCGDPDDRENIVHTIRSVGSVTRALERLTPGQPVGLRGPFGSTWPIEELAGRDVVLVAGGIGLPPLRPVLYHLLRHRANYGKLVLLYGARTPADILYADEFDRWRAGGFQVLATVDRGDPAWRGPVGLVTALFARTDFDPARAIGLMCGPEVMMRFAQREFVKRGVGDDRLYVTLERNMQCAIGLCGHCQFGRAFVCADGPVFRCDTIATFFNVREA
jgi:NAD(P)H-flavin reductase